MHSKSKKSGCGCVKKQSSSSSLATCACKKSYSSTNHESKCTCEQNFYIPFPYTPNCCDGSMGRFAGPVGNVEKAGCNCAHVNYRK